ncbi:MAG TPA: hypothetical protein VN970_09655, partial [Thermoanaerobaculia bacterium]|nr:hypothetical protein [Thermoanaerobaculia bacterium]
MDSPSRPDSRLDFALAVSGLDAGSLPPARQASLFDLLGSLKVAPVVPAAPPAPIVAPAPVAPPAPVSGLARSGPPAPPLRVAVLG